MSHREKIVSYVRTNIDPEFDADSDQLIQVLDSVSLLQLVAYMDQELGMELDLSVLTLDALATVDSILEAFGTEQPEASYGLNP